MWSPPSHLIGALLSPKTQSIPPTQCLWLWGVNRYLNMTKIKFSHANTLYPNLPCFQCSLSQEITHYPLIIKPDPWKSSWWLSSSSSLPKSNQSPRPYWYHFLNHSQTVYFSSSPLSLPYSEASIISQLTIITAF